MALPTTEDGRPPPMGMAAWAHPIQTPSGQQRADFSGVSAAAAPPHHQLVHADFNVNRQQQLQHPHLVHHHQPHLQHQQQFALYDPQYYHQHGEPYASVPYTQAPIDRHPYYPPPQLQAGQLPDSTAAHFDVAPPLSQSRPPAAYKQSFSPDDDLVCAKQESSPTSPPQQQHQAPSTPPYPAPSASRTHRQQPSTDQAMAAQVEVATPVTMVNKTSKSDSGTPTTRKSVRELPSPKAGKKRAREEVDVDGEDDGSGEPEEQQKKRGRPRLTGGGESRGDRRRKQIREAQRAYRNRKDNRIVELEEQVERLEREKGDLSRDMTSVLDILRHQGIDPTSADISRIYSELRRKYPLGIMEYQEGDAQSVMSSHTGRDRLTQHTYPRQTLGTISSASSEHLNGMPGGHVRPQIHGPNLSFGSSGAGFYPPEQFSYEVITQPTPDNASFPSYAPDPRDPSAWIEQPPHPQHPQQVYMQQQVGAEHALVNHTLAGPNSGAALEATFGRRLQRRTLESGLKLISSANPPPERFAAVFGFCLLLESREQIKHRLNICLHSMKEESLNYWPFPFTNLGGAGFSSEHATAGSSIDARIGNQGFYESYKPQHSTGFSMGPFTAHVEAVKDSRLDKRMRINFPGFDGEFLDAEESERYLRDKGITIPPRVDSVEVEISTNDFGDGPETGTVPANMPVNGAQELATTHGAWPMATPVSSADAITTMFTDGTVTGSADPGAMNPFLCPAVPLGSWTSTNPSNPRFKTSINVHILVEELVKRSVCLGRTPGIRTKDIDAAVKIASGHYRAIS